MPRVYHVKKARKDNPAVKAGQPYYWWEFRYGGTRYSATYPRPSQLTQSPYYQLVRSTLEQVEDFDGKTAEDFESFRDEIVTLLEEARDMSQESLDNMPEPLQEGDTGQMLQERIEMTEEAIIGIESMDVDDDDEDIEDRIQEHRDDMTDYVSNTDQ